MQRPDWMRAFLVVGASCVALACGACRHINGTPSDRDPNQPYSYDERPHDTSGPGIDQPPSGGYYGSQYGNPAQFTPPPVGFAGERGAAGPAKGVVGANPGWGYGGNLAGAGTPAASNYPSDIP